MRRLYSLLITFLLPFIILRMLWRSLKAPDYRRRLPERLGFVAPLGVDTPTLWVHAVSLGETLAARPLIEQLIDLYPQHQILVTTTTPTGSAQVRKLFGDRVVHVYAPWDTPGAVRRFVRRTRPELLILMETELWPNMLHFSHRAGTQVLLANARLSARSAAGYARFPRATQAMLANVDWIAAQSSADAERFLTLGMQPSRVEVSGSIKFDVEIDATMQAGAAELRMIWGLSQRPTVLFASSHEGEESVALEAFAALRRQHPAALLMLAPRHPERFAPVQSLCEAGGWSLRTRSSGQAPTPDTAVLLIDTLGELLQLFGVADIAVIGGSFISRGGHNPLEAAAWGKPVLCGDSMFNFEAISQRLRDAGGLQACADAAALAAQLTLLVDNEEERTRRGRAAAGVVQANRGALSALTAAVKRLLGAQR